MRKYDLTLILNPDLDKTGQDKLLEKVKKMITEAGGQVSKLDEWGRKELTYTLKKQKEGFYLNLVVEIEGKEAKGLESKLRNEESLLRHLMVRKE